MNGIVQVTSQTIPEPTGDSAPAGSSYATPLSQNSGELGPSCRTNGSPWDTEDSVVRSIHDMSSGRFYCEESDCGRGFSSKAHLQSHTRFFHRIDVSANCTPLPLEQSPISRQPAQTMEGGEDDIAPPKNPPEAGKHPTEHPSVYFSPPSNVSLPGPSEERATWGSPYVPGSVGTSGPTLPPEGYRDPSLNAGRGAQQELESSFEPRAAARGDGNVQLAVTLSTPLSLKCRICNASPTAGSRPTATVCGHIFCSEYVPKIPSGAATGLTPC